MAADERFLKLLGTALLEWNPKSRTNRFPTRAVIARLEQIIADPSLTDRQIVDSLLRFVAEREG